VMAWNALSSKVVQSKRPQVTLYMNQTALQPISSKKITYSKEQCDVWYQFEHDGQKIVHYEV
jgi:hypothetical protein